MLLTEVVFLRMGRSNVEAAILVDVKTFLVEVAMWEVVAQ